MLTQSMKTIRGFLLLLIYLIILVSFAIVTLVVAVFVWIIPWKPWRRITTPFLLKFPVWWIDFNKLVMMLSNHGKWDIQGSGELDRKKWYMLISNHATWLDILVLGYVFNHKAPIMKFFMKKELIWSLPIAGFSCYIMGYPFMERVTRDDIRKNPALKNADTMNTKKACEKLKEFPTTIMSFLEGTRFTKEKHERQASPYQYLLKPKAGGCAIVLNEMQENVKEIINVTIFYETNEISFWNFACGNFSKIRVRYEVLPVTPELIGDYNNNREFRKTFQQWLNKLWQNKDNLLRELNGQ